MDTQEHVTKSLPIGRYLSVESPQDFETSINEVWELLDEKRQWLVEKVGQGKLTPFEAFRVFAADAAVMTGYDELIGHSAPGPSISALEYASSRQPASSRN